MLVYQRVPTAVGFLSTFGEVVASCKAALHVLGTDREKPPGWECLVKVQPVTVGKWINWTSTIYDIWMMNDDDCFLNDIPINDLSLYKYIYIYTHTDAFDCLKRCIFPFSKCLLRQVPELKCLLPEVGIPPGTKKFHGYFRGLDMRYEWIWLINQYWLVVSNMTFIFHFIHGMSSQPHWLTHIFQDGDCTTKQNMTWG